MSLVFRIQGLNFYLSSSSSSVSNVNHRPPFAQPSHPLSRAFFDDIDRRNERVLHSLGSQSTTALPSISPTSAVCLEAAENARARRQSPFHWDTKASNVVQNCTNEHRSDVSNNSDSSVSLDINAIRSNKASILHLLKQNIVDRGNSKMCVEKNGVIVSEDGPFWPENHRLLHPTPKLPTRHLTQQEESPLSSSVSGKRNDRRSMFFPFDLGDRCLSQSQH